MRLQQALSFSPLLLRIPRSPAVFWPGCALMKYDGAILRKTLEVLRREEAMETAAGCCGQPTVYLFPEAAEKRRRKLRSALEQSGTRRIYTACPNCALELGKLDGIKILPIWPVLLRHLKPDDLAPSNAERYMLHDPCPLRKDPRQLESVRALLRMAGAEFSEPEHSGECARCCGNIHMLRARDPERSARLRALCLSEFPGERTVTACCAGCLDAFSGEGRKTAHLLEILFGTSLQKSWGNRLKLTRSIR